MTEFVYPKMTEAELVKYVFDALIKQGGPSLLPSEDGHRCAYRGEGGRKCAAGVLIPDEVFDSEFNIGISWHTLVSALDLPKEHLDLICTMQSAHDQAFRGKLWNESLSQFFRHYVPQDLCDAAGVPPSVY